MPGLVSGISKKEKGRLRFIPVLSAGNECSKLIAQIQLAEGSRRKLLDIKCLYTKVYSYGAFNFSEHFVNYIMSSSSMCGENHQRNLLALDFMSASLQTCAHRMLVLGSKKHPFCLQREKLILRKVK